MAKLTDWLVYLVIFSFGVFFCLFSFNAVSENGEHASVLILLLIGLPILAMMIFAFPPLNQRVFARCKSRWRIVAIKGTFFLLYPAYVVAISSVNSVVSDKVAIANKEASAKAAIDKGNDECDQYRAAQKICVAAPNYSECMLRVNSANCAREKLKDALTDLEKSTDELVGSGR